MDDFDRAQLAEQAEREFLQRQHADRPRPKPVAVQRPDGGTDYYCAECDDDLPAHRVEFGICIECATVAEARAKQYARS